MIHRSHKVKTDISPHSVDNFSTSLNVLQLRFLHIAPFEYVEVCLEDSWLIYSLLPLMQLHKWQNRPHVLYMVFFNSTYTHTHPWALSFLSNLISKRRSLSKRLTWQLISCVAHRNDYCHKSLPTLLRVARSIFRKAEFLCRVNLYWALFFFLFSFFFFINWCFIIFPRAYNSKVVQMCK